MGDDVLDLRITQVSTIPTYLSYVGRSLAMQFAAPSLAVRSAPSCNVESWPVLSLAGYAARGQGSKKPCWWLLARAGRWPPNCLRASCCRG